MTQIALYAAVLWVTAAFVAGSVLGAGVVWWDKRGDYEEGRQDEYCDLTEPEPEADDDFEDYEHYDSRDWMDAPEDDAVTVQWIAELADLGGRESVLDRARRVVPQ
jgi:hypothetical protein